MVIVSHNVHCISSTLIGGKCKPVQVRFTLCSRDQHSKWMQDGCKVYMDSYMASNGSCFMVTWIIFLNHLLEVGQTQNRETIALQNLTTVDLLYIIIWEDTIWIESHWNNVWLRAQYIWLHTHLRAWDHITWFWKCLRMMAFEHFFWALNFMIIALSLCVKWPWVLVWGVSHTTKDGWFYNGQHPQARIFVSSFKFCGCIVWELPNRS